MGNSAMGEEGETEAKTEAKMKSVRVIGVDIGVRALTVVLSEHRRLDGLSKLVKGILFAEVSTVSSLQKYLIGINGVFANKFSYFPTMTC